MSHKGESERLVGACHEVYGNVDASRDGRNT